MDKTKKEDKIEVPKAQTKKGLKYIGHGHFLPDVPARDLTAEEVLKYGGRKYLLASKIYK